MIHGYIGNIRYYSGVYTGIKSDSFENFPINVYSRWCKNELELNNSSCSAGISIGSYAEGTMKEKSTTLRGDVYDEYAL